MCTAGWLRGPQRRGIRLQQFSYCKSVPQSTAFFQTPAGKKKRKKTSHANLVVFALFNLFDSRIWNTLLPGLRHLTPLSLSLPSGTTSKYTLSLNISAGQFAWLLQFRKNSIESPQPTHDKQLPSLSEPAHYEQHQAPRSLPRKNNINPGRTLSRPIQDEH